MPRQPVSIRFDLARAKPFLSLGPLLSMSSRRIRPSYSASKIWTEWESNLTIWQTCLFGEKRLFLSYANGDIHGCCCTTLKKHLLGVTLQRQSCVNYIADSVTHPYNVSLESCRERVTRSNRELLNTHKILPPVPNEWQGSRPIQVHS